MNARTVIVKGKYVGELPPPRLIRTERGLVRRVQDSVLCVCPTCGDVWAIIGGSPDAEWYPHRAHCERHLVNRWGTVGGSLLINFALVDVTLDQLPEPLVQREARLHLQYWEKRNEIEETTDGSGSL